MQVNEALRAVRAFLKGLGDAEDSEDMFDGFIGFGEVPEQITLSGGKRREYIQCVNNLLESMAKDEKFSRLGLEDLLKQTIRMVWSKESDFDKVTDKQVVRAVDWLRNTLAADAKTYLVYLPILGIDHHNLPQTIGKIRLLSGNTQNITSIKKPVLAIIKSLKNEERDKAALRKHTSEDISNNFCNNVIAEVQVFAGDNQNAEEKAREECQSTVDVLNFYSDVFGSSIDTAYVRLRTERNQFSQPTNRRKSQGIILTMRERTEADPSSARHGEREIAEYSARRSSVGPLSELMLPHPGSKITQDSGLSRLAELLAKDKRTPLEDRILCAFQWAGRATVDTRNEEAFLLYMIALESLVLMKSEKSETTFQLKLKAAHLLKTTVRARKDLAARLGKLYRLRSQIVHSGNFHVTESEVSEIREYTKKALVTVVNSEEFKNMTTEQEFDDWLEHKLLS